LGVPYLNIALLLQEVKAAEDLRLTVTRSSSKKMASKVGAGAGSSVADHDPGSGAFLNPGSGIRDW
jgi:hypothetical protein